MTDKAPVGGIRPSQLLWSYGPGAMVDLPNLSVMTMGIDAWEESRCVLVQEARLLGAVQKGSRSSGQKFEEVADQTFRNQGSVFS